MTVARPLAEYHEDFGPVLWWRFPVTEPPYVGSPLDTGRTLKVIVDGQIFLPMVGGWPGYHTHWTPLPPIPKKPRIPFVPKIRCVSDEGRARGGYARAESLSPERRAEIGRMGAAARWGND